MVRILLCLLAPVLLAAAPPPIVLKAARLFDSRTGNMVSPAVLVVVNGKIAGVGAQAPVPAGARTIDLGDATLLPGFLDAHTHLTFRSTEDAKQDRLDEYTKTIPEKTLDAATNARKTLMAGFTTVRDVGSSDFIDIGLRNAIQRGEAVGPRMLVAVHAIGTTGGHCDPTDGSRPELLPEPDYRLGIANSPDGMRAAVRYNLKHGADVIKTCATGGVLSLADAVDTPQLTQAELDALIGEAHDLRKRVAAHAHGAEGAKRAIRAGVDSIEHGSFLDEEALELMRAKGTYLVPTLMAIQGLRERMDRGVFMDPRIRVKAQAAMSAIDETFKKAMAKGVRVALGTDAGVYPHGRNPEEFYQMVRRGMAPVTALQVGTRHTAELLGLGDKVGVLEFGYLADVVAVPGNPATDIHQTEKVFFVMKEGLIFRNDRDTSMPSGSF